MKRKLIHILGLSLSTTAQGNRGSACLLALVLAVAVPSFAKTLTVSNTNDSGPGSLRDTIAVANAGDTIEFGVTGTINLTSDSLTLDKNLTIKGPGAAQLAISGVGGEFRILFIASGTIAISGLTIQHGEVVTSPFFGAGILNHGTLTLIESTVSDNENEVGSGGGIYNDGTLTLVRSTVSKNDTNISGGGIVNSGSLTLINTTVSDNFTLEGDGGGINNGSTLTLTNSTVSGNLSFNGGGIFNSGTLAAANSTVSDNSTQTSGAGGGVYNQGGTVTVTNSTFAGNSALTDAGGGGIYNDGGTFTVTNSTVADNSTSHQGGGIYNAGVLTAKNTLLANNVTLSGEDTANCDLVSGTATSLGYNISDDNSCASFLTAPGDETNVTPGAGLDPKGLQNNGGPTQTFALLPGSLAVDHIPVADCTDANGNPVKTDQRGIKRPQGPACDTGAFELVQTVPFSNFTASLAIQTGHDPSFGLTARFTLGAGSDGIALLTQPVTLQIANYTVEIPAGSFHPLWNSPSAPFIYEGIINGTNLVVGIIPLGGNNYEFSAVGSPVSWVNVTNPVTVSLTVGNDGGGSTPVRAFIANH